MVMTFKKICTTIDNNNNNNNNNNNKNKNNSNNNNIRSALTPE